MKTVELQDIPVIQPADKVISLASSHEEDVRNLVIAHGCFMWITWTILGLVQLGTNRWYSYVTNRGQYIHAAFGFTILAMTMAVAFMLTYYIPFVINRSIHTQFGFSMLIGVVIIVLLGIAAYYTKQNTEWNTKRVLLIRFFHRRVALAFILIGYLTLTLGILEFLMK